MGWLSRKPVGIAVSFLGIFAVAFVFLSKAGMIGLSTSNLEQKVETVPIVPSGPACSQPSDNCLNTGCCKVSGQTCYQKNPSWAGCRESCTPGVDGWSCGKPWTADKSMPVEYDPGTTMYCFAVYTENTGSTKKSYELDLLRSQLKFGAGMFGCNRWDVFSDVNVELSPGPPTPLYTVQVTDPLNEFHRAKRPETGVWVNWGVFFQVWLMIRSNGKWHDYDWTVKVDADAVFLPQRLVNWLRPKKTTPHGIYFENCKNVQYGFFGNIEVFSQKAAAVYTANLEDCHQELGECAMSGRGCDWTWGPWGEDVFAQKCMDRHGVEKVEAFDLTTDGACEADRPADQKWNKHWKAPDCSNVTTPVIHPYKTPTEWFACLGQIMHRDYNL